MVRGFDHFEPPIDSRTTRAETVVPRVRSWVGENRDHGPIFIWVHLFDPHAPYAPPASFRRDLDPDLASRFPVISWRELEAVAAENDGDIPADVLAHARLLYRGEVEYTDHWIGELLKAFSDDGDIDDLLVVLTADHGECFERGIFFEHSECLYQEGVQVPLIVHLPGGAPRGRVLRQVSNIDIAPTLLAAAGLDIPEDYSGIPLTASDRGPGPDRLVLLQYPYYSEKRAAKRNRRYERIRSVAGIPTEKVVADSDRRGIVGGGWKYLHGNGSESLFRISPGGSESLDLVTAEEETVRVLRQGLNALLEQHGFEPSEKLMEDEELEEALKALGYL
jgi:arylsulfatase A-like enzyme